jgi:1-acyl-sn-glycerol-3-phosphate acyltransferase
VRHLVPVTAALAYAASLIAIAIWPPLVALALALTWPFDRNRVVAGRLLRLCGAFVSRTFPFWRIRIEGRWPGRGAYVVVANHQSFLDIFLLSNIPHEMKWVAKRELFRIPWVGWSFYLSGDIPIDRGDLASTIECSPARRYLQRGIGVCGIFPRARSEEEAPPLQRSARSSWPSARRAGPVSCVSGTGRNAEEAVGSPVAAHRAHPGPGADGRPRRP